VNRSCLDIQSHLSAWLDGELAGDVSEVVRDHLAECSECRAFAEALQQLDTTFEKAAAIYNDAVARIAVNVLSSIANDRAVDRAVGGEALKGTPQPLPEGNVTRPEIQERTRSLSSRVTPFLVPVSTAAAGFLLAWMIFAPSSREVVTNEEPQPAFKVQEPELPRVEPPVARLVAATGSVECRQPGQADWSLLDEKSSSHCSRGTKVRTAAGVRCELETEDHCIIRLNEETELAIRSPREIELRSGEVWCRSTSDVKLQVIAASRHRAPANANLALCFTCPANGTLISEVDPQGGCRIQSATGDVDVSLGTTLRRLKRGEIARFDDGQLVIEPHHADSLLATSWMQPLLVLKGHDSPELGDRVNRLLANLGRSKLDNLYEDEIRSLGDYAVLPLLRFVQSESSREAPNQRHRAMSIVADMAPAWLIGDLIELLADPEPAVRIQAAAALERLTRLSQGREPAQWSAPLPERNESLGRWRIWWKENSGRYERRQKGSDPMKDKNA
jgi:hypothetical protein